MKTFLTAETQRRREEKKETFNIQHSTLNAHVKKLRCSMLNVECSMFRFFSLRLCVSAVKNFLVLSVSFLVGAVPAASAQDPVAAVVQTADQWRAGHRLIDLHQHLD